MTPEQKEIFGSFIVEALAFCDTVDSYQTIPLGRFVREFAIRVVRLYAAALQLPDLTWHTSDKTSEVLADAFTCEQEAALTHALEEKLWSHNTYREIFDPYDDPDEEAIYGSLGRDLAEICDDLRDVLAAYDQTNEENLHETLWSARFQFGYHWSEHATKALRVMDSLLYRQYIESLEGDLDA